MGYLMGGFKLSDFKICYKAAAIETVKHWQKDRYRD